MFIGVCENCRYTDLIENDQSICPRCGGKIISLGVGSALWNRMTYPDKTALINSRFPREEKTEETPLDQSVEEPLATVDKEPSELSEKISEEPSETISSESEEETSAETSAEPPEEISAESSAEVLSESPDKTSTEVSAPPPEDTQFNKKLNEFVYVCYKCDSIVSHDSDTEKYYCSECGSDMIWTGFTTYEWGKLSIRAKRNATDNSKIRYIESRIKKTDFKSS